MYDERCLKIIGANIKLLRTCRGISQGELARALVISQTHLSKISVFYYVPLMRWSVH